MRIQRLKLSNGKEVAILISAEAGIVIFVSTPGREWERSDNQILDNIKIPGDALVASQEF